MHATNLYAPLYHAEIATLQAAICELRKHTPSKRTSALIAMREERIEELMGCVDMLDGGVDETERVETSAALEVAIETAVLVGCAVVTGACALAMELARLVPGCTMRQGDLYVSTVKVDGGELRLVRRSGSYRGAMSWRAA